MDIVIQAAERIRCGIADTGIRLHDGDIHYHAVQRIYIKKIIIQVTDAGQPCVRIQLIRIL